MFIEDFINRLASDGVYLFDDSIALLSMDRSIVSSISSQILMGNGFTEKQSVLAVRLSKKYSKQLSIALKIDITPFVDNPQFKLPFRTLDNSRKIQIKKLQNSNKRVISVSFPYHEELVAQIKTYKKILSQTSHTGNGVNWNLESRSWDFDLREEHVDWINANLVNSSFLADELFLDLIEQIENVKSNLENYIPIIKFTGKKFIYENVPNGVLQPTSTDLIDVIFQGRKYGITTWTDDIDIALSKLNLNSTLYNFLTSPDITSLPKDKEKLTISDIGSIISYSLPCLVIIPGGSELKHLEYCRALFEKNGISNDEMCVLFRLDNTSGKTCNDFIKNQKLNNPLTDTTKIVFISGKVPKPLVESKMIFSTILNLGISGVHYTLSNYLKNHHFVINYTLKETDFADM
jgi:hypothetical protein